MGYEIGKKVWVMGFYRDMGYPCKPNRWMPKVMSYYRVWVIREMGYDRVDCSLAELWCGTPKHHYFCATEMEGSKFPWFLIPLVEMLLLMVWSNFPNQFLFGPKLIELYNFGIYIWPDYIMQPKYSNIIYNIIIIICNRRLSILCIQN